FSQRDGQGYALFRAGTRGPLFVAAGTAVLPGIRLDAVQPGSVTLLEGGFRRDIPLRRVAAGDKARVATALPRTAQCAAPAGFAGPILRLNAELLSGMINAPDTWKALVQTGPGGLLVSDQSGFGAMMALCNGERLK